MGKLRTTAITKGKSDSFLKEISKTVNKVLKAMSEKNPSSKYEIDDLGLPHKPKPLPKGKTAVYMFYCPKEKSFLKIGRVGIKSNARFSYQHYNPAYSKSNLASSILNDDKMKMNFKLTNENIGGWIKENCRRINVLFDGKETNPFASELVEACLHYKYNPRYEGKSNNEAEV